MSSKKIPMSLSLIFFSPKTLMLSFALALPAAMSDAYRLESPAKSSAHLALLSACLAKYALIPLRVSPLSLIVSMLPTNSLFPTLALALFLSAMAYSSAVAGTSGVKCLKLASVVVLRYLSSFVRYTTSYFPAPFATITGANTP